MTLSNRKWPSPCFGPSPLLQHPQTGEKIIETSTKQSFQRCNFLLTVGSFLLTMGLFYFQLTILALFLTIGVLFAYGFSFFTYSWSFFAYNGKVPPIRALRDCKQKGLSVSKKAPTVSKKSLPQKFSEVLTSGSSSHFSSGRSHEELRELLKR